MSEIRSIISEWRNMKRPYMTTTDTPQAQAERALAELKRLQEIETAAVALAGGPYYLEGSRGMIVVGKREYLKLAALLERKP